MISGEKVLSSISALRKMMSPYSRVKSARYGEASSAAVQRFVYSLSSGPAAFQNFSSAS